MTNLSDTGSGNGGWDDARLGAAYHAAFEVETPAGLGHRIRAGLVSEHATRRFLRIPRFAPAAASLVALVAIAVTTISLGALSPRPTIRPASSVPGPGQVTTPTAAGSQTATSGLPWPFPDRVTTSGTDLIPVSVEDAVHLRATVATPAEIAVYGWQSNATEVRYCTLAFRGLVGELENQCVYNRWLAETPEPTTDWYDPPQRPAFRLAGDPIWSVPNLLAWGDPGTMHFRGASVAVVVVGHFHDPASTQCRSDAMQLCADTFVVDQVPFVLSLANAPTGSPAPGDIAAMTVPEAIDVRNSDSAREIAVGGWFAAYPVPCPLPYTDAQRPLEDCFANFSWLMRDPEQLQVLASDGSGSIHRPVGPSISLVLDQVDLPLALPLPARAVLVGHFNDPRSSECPAGLRRTACLSRFVVDLVLAIDDAATPSLSP